MLILMHAVLGKVDEEYHGDPQEPAPQKSRNLLKALAFTKLARPPLHPHATQQQIAWSSSGGQSFLGQQMAQPSDFSMATADKIDNEVKKLVERAYRWVTGRAWVTGRDLWLAACCACAGSTVDRC